MWEWQAKGTQTDCVDEISRSRAGTIKRKSTAVDPGRVAAIAAVTNYVWATFLLFISDLGGGEGTDEVATGHGMTVMVKR